MITDTPSRLGAAIDGAITGTLVSVVQWRGVASWLAAVAAGVVVALLCRALHVRWVRRRERAGDAS